MDPEQNLPSKGRCHFDDKVGKNPSREPFKAGMSQRLAHLRQFFGVVINPKQQGNGDRELNDGQDNFLHSPNRFFQVSTER